MPLSLRIGTTIVAVAVAVSSAACGRDTTAPAPTLAVSIALAGPPSQRITESTYGVQIACTFVLTATAQGSGSATWQDGVIRFYSGVNRTVAVDSQALWASDLARAFGTGIAPGDQPRLTWFFARAVPFETEMEVHSIDQNGTVVAPSKVRFVCGPVPTAGAAAPSITQLSVAGLAGDVQPGAPIDVTYTATSTSPLWSTSVAVTGPFTVQTELAEWGVRSVTRTVRIVVPLESRLGVPITITVVATDAGAQRTSQVVQTGRSVVDRSSLHDP